MSLSFMPMGKLIPTHVLVLRVPVFAASTLYFSSVFIFILYFCACPKFKQYKTKQNTPNSLDCGVS